MALLESGMLLFWPLIVVILIVGLLSFFTVQTAQVAVITRFGKFLRVAEPGLNWKWPFIDRVAGRVSLRVNQITLTMETKTKDNVFVTIPIQCRTAFALKKCTTPSTSSPTRCSRSKPMSSRSFSAMCPA
jgi:regulator of protease activity HflC (stomatin/prohibitin superfamily)